MSDMQRKLRRVVQVSFYSSYIAAIRFAERFLGAPALAAIAALITLWECLRPQRLRDFRHFKEMRKNLPDAFWKGLGPKRHYVRMLFDWHTAVFCEILYDRWWLPRLTERVTVRGTPPDQLPGFKERPVIIAFMHTGTFGVLFPWLRSNRLSAINYGVRPAVANFFYNLHKAGDARYETPAPHYLSSKQLRILSQHLRDPGHALVISIDGKPLMPGADVQVGGNIMHLHDGAVRFAIKNKAILITAAAIRTGPFRFEIHYGQPVPEALLSRENTEPALEWLAEELWSGLRAHPAAITWTTLEALAPTKVIPRMPWP